ncbi:MAG: hypothetical protein A3J67_02955 [Parcubacteria group bacterium RIFCSPHIGHO2_02_FULL_48_10b]|nr:MAG: hypothetical protein A3J67_02955 [Parcubacteria group bacterium RIFCSPHIGHO2_02_FULL_48_10b]
MKGIKTENIFVPCQQDESLESIFSKANELLIRGKKKPLRMVLLEIVNAKAKLLASFIYEK